jgi:hypothetical protein
MKNKPFYVVESGLERLIRMKKEKKKMEELQDEVQEIMLKQQLMDRPMLKFGRKK